MMDLGISVAAGVPFWGHETTQGRVLYLDFELQEAFFQDRLDKIANAKGVTMETLDNIDVWNLRGHAADLSTIVEEIIERIKETPYALIIIDPIYKVLGNRDENSAGDITSLMNELDKIAVASRAAIVVGHHFSKGNQAWNCILFVIPCTSFCSYPSSCGPIPCTMSSRNVPSWAATRSLAWFSP